MPIRRITFADLRAALAAGLADFRARPSHAVFLCAIYPVVGIILVRATVRGGVLPLLFPLVAGFAILAPLAAVTTCEVSRRREVGAASTWRDIGRIVGLHAMPQVAELAVLLLVIFVAWLDTAQAIFVATLGPQDPMSLSEFAHAALLTTKGRELIALGGLVGSGFATLAFTLAVVSFPMLIDRRVSLFTAIATSVRCVAANPLVLAAWGLILTLALAAGMALLFAGLAVVLPVLGHASWHLYRALVPPEETPPAVIAARPQLVS